MADNVQDTSSELCMVIIDCCLSSFVCQYTVSGHICRISSTLCTIGLYDTSSAHRKKHSFQSSEPVTLNFAIDLIACMHVYSALTWKHIN